MFWFKLRVHFGINIEVFFYFGGMGVKWPIFLGFFKKIQFLYSVQKYVVVQIKGSFLHKYRSIFFILGGMGVKWPIFSLKI